MHCKQPKNMCSNSSSPVPGSKAKPPGLLVHCLCDGFKTCKLITGNLHQKRPCTTANLWSLERLFRTTGNSTLETCISYVCIEDIFKALSKFYSHCKVPLHYCPWSVMKQQCFVCSTLQEDLGYLNLPSPFSIITTQYTNQQTHKGLHRIGGQIKLRHSLYSLSGHQIIEIQNNTLIQLPLLSV